MSDYSQGKIYMLTSEQTPEVYIGSTKETLEIRLTKHKSDYKGWFGGNPIYSYKTSYEIIKYDDCKIQLIENYPCESRKELELKEGEYQRMMDCINKRVEGRTQKEYREDNKERIEEYREVNREKILQQQREYAKEYRKNNPEKIKEQQKEYKQNNPEKIKKYQEEYSKNNIERLKEYRKEYYKNRPKIKCVCGSEIRKADTRRHQRTQKHIKYIQEMKEKADATNLNEFFEQFKFKLTTK